MVDKNNTGGELNSVFLLGGIAAVTVGGLVYWFMNKTEVDESVAPNLEDFVPNTKNLIEDKHSIKRKTKKRRNDVEEDEVAKTQVKPNVVEQVQPTPVPVEVSKPVEEKSSKKKKGKQVEEVKPVPVVVDKKQPQPTKAEPTLNKKERKLQKQQQIVEEEKKKIDDETGWTVVDKKQRKPVNVQGKEEVLKAKQELRTYLNEF